MFCGGCNPQIDRGAVAAEAAELAANDPSVPSGAVVHLSGCARACASGHALTGRPEPAGDHASPQIGEDPPVVVVAGELVDGVPTSAAELAPAVIRKLKE